MSIHAPEFSKNDLDQEKERLRTLLKKSDNAWEAIEEFARSKGNREINGKTPKLEEALESVAHKTLQGSVNGDDPYMVSQAVKMEMLPKREQSI